MSQGPNWRDNDNKEMDVDSPFLLWRWNGFRYERITWIKIRNKIDQSSRVRLVLSYFTRHEVKVLVWDEYHDNHGMIDIDF
jgi:hypothetical protein